MRISFRRTSAAALGVLLAAAALTGCGSDDDSTATTTTAAVTTTAAAAKADEATTKAITDAFTTFFNAKTPTEQRIATVEKGQEFAAVLQAAAANPQASGTSATVSAVKVVDATHADVTYTLLLNGTPALPDQAGNAVKEGDKWKVATITFCALLAIQGGTSTAC
ncbi:hypothetical protein ACWIGI_25435 [Nocardia sp. NPDC055321]